MFDPLLILRPEGELLRALRRIRILARVAERH